MGICEVVVDRGGCRSSCGCGGKRIWVDDDVVLVEDDAVVGGLW